MDGTSEDADDAGAGWGASAVGRGSGDAGADALAGRPEPSRAVQRAFWRLIASGVTTVQAAEGVGVSAPVGIRWFRHAGGMTPLSLDEPTGRYLSFAEREEIALLRAQDRACVRSPARSAATPGPSLVSCAETLPPGAASWTTARWWLSGRHSRPRSVRRPRSW